MNARAEIRAFFDEPTNTVSYLVTDPVSRRAAVIDPVLDYDQSSGEASSRSAQAILAAAEAAKSTIDWVLETHAHADHVSGAPYIKLAQDRGCGIRRGHPVLAGLRHGPRRLSRRRCPRALSLDEAAAGAPARDAPVHVPRLKGAGARSLCLGNYIRRAARAKRARPGRRFRG